MDTPAEIFFEFSNPTRLHILVLLREEAHALSELAEKIAVSKPEVSRHVGRLVDHGLVVKDPNTRKYRLGLLGLNAMALLHPLKFLFRHPAFFRTHRVTDLAPHLLTGIAALDGAEIVQGTGNAMHSVRDVIAGASEIWILTAQSFPFETPGLTYHLIITPALYEEKVKEYPDFIERMDAEVELFTCPDVPFTLAVSDDHKGILFFPAETGEADYEEACVVSDADGLHFLHEIYESFLAAATRVI